VTVTSLMATSTINNII